MSTVERDNQLLSVGAQCAHEFCRIVDFLPFKCNHCSQSFCQEHFTVESHKCSKYDESKHNRVAPNCQLCNQPVAIPPGQDPNIRMEAHLAQDCSVVTGRAAKKTGPVCARAKCGKLLFSPIKCDKCREQFCPSHRFPSDHNCSAASTTNLPSTAPSMAAVNANAKALNTKASAAGAATMTAIKKGIASANAAASSATAPKPSSDASPNKSTPNPFSKTDRRARAEKESRRKALRERAKKGLLSEQEKQLLAQEEAELAQADHQKKDCVIM